MLTLPPLSVYIHYPWCVKKCPYCDFNSHEKGRTKDYIHALIKDLEQDLPYVQDRKIKSIFIGGGTPSLMSPSELESILDTVQKKLKLKSDIEITLESNPGTFELEKFKDFHTVGINRLSVGVQSFCDQHLESLGRIHSAKEAHKACTKAVEIFDNLNIDLMFGLQNQTLQNCIDDVQTAINLAPTHISFYQLTLEPNTYFAKFPPKLPADDDIWQMSDEGIKLLEKNGFLRYEVSAFGKIPSKHNLNYWQFGDYIGIGAGAHGKITDIENNKIFRTVKSKSPADYLKKIGKKVTLIDNLPFDFMLNALRLKQGVDVDLFNQRTGLNINTIDNKLDKAKSLGLLSESNAIIKSTQKGYDFLNDLQSIFL